MSRHANLGLGQDGNALQSLMQRIQKVPCRVHVFLHQPVSEFAKFDPGLGRFYPAEFFRTEQVVELLAGFLKAGAQQRGQKFVAQGVLQASIARDECVEHFAVFITVFKRFDPGKIDVQGSKSVRCSFKITCCLCRYPNQLLHD